MAPGPQLRRLDQTNNPTPPQAGRCLAAPCWPACLTLSLSAAPQDPRGHTVSAWTKAKFSVASGEALSCLLPALTLSSEWCL